MGVGDIAQPIGALAAAYEELCLDSSTHVSCGHMNMQITLVRWEEVVETRRSVGLAGCQSCFSFGERCCLKRISKEVKDYGMWYLCLASM